MSRVKVNEEFIGGHLSELGQHGQWGKGGRFYKGSPHQKAEEAVKLQTQAAARGKKEEVWQEKEAARYAEHERKRAEKYRLRKIRKGAEAAAEAQAAKGVRARMAVTADLKRGKNVNVDQYLTYDDAGNAIVPGWLQPYFE